VRDRRFVAVDRERGIVFAFGFFDHHRVLASRAFRAKCTTCGSPPERASRSRAPSPRP
jgi:hypothetical protein